MVTRSDAVSPEWVARIEQRVAALESSLSALAVNLPNPEGWQRMQAYADQAGVSIRTVDRDVERGVLEKRKEPGTNRAYVRPARSEQPPARPQRRRRRGVPTAADSAAVPATAAPGAPIWPYGRAY
jgi:hypothetical protein